MSESSRPPSPGQQGDPRQIAKWARIYAQNRSLPFVVFMLVFILLSAAIGVPSYVAGFAYLSGNTPLLAVCIGVLAVAVAALIYVAVPWWGGRRMDRLAATLYSKEGQATVCAAGTRKRKLLGGLLGGVYGTCILLSVILGFRGYIPDEYMQPISALYVVPFMIALMLLNRPAGWPLMFLWPVLYSLHAVLVLAGVPIQPGRGLDVVVPIAGYGLLAGLAAHVYSRYALYKLRRAARSDLPGTDGGGERP